MTMIENVRGREVIDSRDNPTVEVEVFLESGVHGRPAFPSTGTRVAAVNGEIADSLRGCDALDQIAVDRLLRDLDGSDNKDRLGADYFVRAPRGSAPMA